MKQFKMPLNRKKNKDCGLVILFGLLVWYLHSDNKAFLWLSVFCILVSLMIPIVLTPISFAWYALSDAMGWLLSRFLLSAIFFCIITPIGALRRVIGKERLLTEQWKKSRESVFKDKNVRFSSSDIKNQF